MCMTPQELEALTNQKLVENFQKAVELDAKSSGNGKNPFDKDQLRDELMKRLDSKPEVYVKEEREAGDGHDEFS